MTKNLLFSGRQSLDLTESIRDYEYTKKSVVNLNRIINSKQFQEMDSETIFQYLKKEMEIVSFGDYLKRFLYEESGLSEPFTEIPDQYYISVIEESFAANKSPYCFTPVTTSRNSIIRRWLHSGTVERSTVFVIGFGLRMTDQEGAVFLTKVLKEQDFCFNDPVETVYWYCFHHGYPYSTALSLLEGSEFSSEDRKDVPDSAFWHSVRESLPVYLSNKPMLEKYLAYFKFSKEDRVEAAYTEFSRIYGQAVCAARQELREDPVSEGRNQELSGAFDIESVLCSGNPKTHSGNLTAASRSSLSAHFKRKRMSRQRISRLLNRKAKVERFDLITLLFLIYAVNTEAGSPEMRCRNYIDEMNACLKRCDMMELYPVNPYESFILMCLLTEEPLSVYNDVWEMSCERDFGEQVSSEPDD